MSNDATVPLLDLDSIRSTLAAVMQYLQAEDIAQAQRKLMPTVEYSALTREVSRLVSRVDNIMKDHLLTAHDEVAEKVDVNEQPADEDALN